MATLKECRSCHKKLPLSAFGNLTASIDRRTNICKPCVKAKHRLARGAPMWEILGLKKNNNPYSKIYIEKGSQSFDGIKNSYGKK